MASLNQKKRIDDSLGWIDLCIRKLNKERTGLSLEEIHEYYWLINRNIISKIFFFKRKSLIMGKKNLLESMDLMMNEIIEQKATSQGNSIDRRRMNFISMKSIEDT